MRRRRRGSRRRRRRRRGKVSKFKMVEYSSFNAPTFADVPTSSNVYVTVNVDNPVIL